MKEASDSDYFAAFDRGALDPDECVAGWEAGCASARDNLVQLVAIVEARGLDPADAEAVLEPAKLLLADCQRQRAAARRRRAEWRWSQVQVLSSAPVKVLGNGRRSGSRW